MCKRSREKVIVVAKSLVKACGAVEDDDAWWKNEENMDRG